MSNTNKYYRICSSFLCVFFTASLHSTQTNLSIIFYFFYFGARAEILNVNLVFFNRIVPLLKIIFLLKFRTVYRLSTNQYMYVRYLSLSTGASRCSVLGLFWRSELSLWSNGTHLGAIEAYSGTDEASLEQWRPTQSIVGTPWNHVGLLYNRKATTPGSSLGLSCCRWLA